MYPDVLLSSDVVSGEYLMRIITDGKNCNDLQREILDQVLGVIAEKIPERMEFYEQNSCEIRVTADSGKNVFMLLLR